MTRTEITATVTGSVWDVSVSVGDTVSAGDELVVAEAMKMEIAIEATVAGTVVELHVSKDDEIEEGAVIAVIES